MTLYYHTPQRLHSLSMILSSGGLLLGLLLTSSPAQVTTAITPDGTLGTTAIRNGTLYDITGGRRPENGPNLFHSFNRFTVGTGDTARFSGPTGIKNILSRVTGGQQSLIDGRLQSTIPGANLYLLNPSGVVFGSNASLDVSGSFHVSTADYLRFADGATFSAHLGAQSTLTVAPPAAFGFLTQNPARIAIQGSKLGVPPGETLSIVGGDIEIVGRGASIDDFAELSAPSGRINIASVASPGEVTPNAPGGNPDLGMHSFTRLGEVALSQDVTISVAGDPGGTVVIRSGRLTMDDTRITAATRGDADHPGVGVDVHVTGDMILTNRTAMPFSNAEIASSSFGAGDAGDIRIVAGSLQLIGNPSLRIGSNIGSRAFGSGDNAGNAGDIKITTGSLLMQNGAGIETATFGPGAGGNILIEAGNIQMLGLERFALISTSSFGSGDAGNMEVRAGRVLLRGGVEGFTGLATQVSPQVQGKANAGTLRLITDRLEVLDGAQISAIVATGSGRGGDIEVTAGTIIIAGTDPEGNPAGIFASTEGGTRTIGNAGDIRITAKDMRLTDKGQLSAFSASLGNSGNIYIQTGELQITHGSFLSSTNTGAGAAGDIEIHADSVRLAGPSPEGEFTGLFSFGTIFAQAAGDIRITAGTLEILDGAHISSRTTGPGDGGTIEIRAKRVRIEGSDPGSASFDGPQAGIFASTLIVQDFVDQATGQAGDIRIQADALEMHDQGTINTMSASAGDGGAIDIVAKHLTLTSGALITTKSTGMGDAGNIRLMATNTLLSENSTVTTEASQTDGGNILVTAQSLIRLRGSEISATVGGGPETVGGNITIDPEFVIMENSQIRANAFEGRGGNVQITAGVFLADPTSQVSASSTLGIDGQVDIRAPVTNLSGVVSPLPSGFAPATALLAGNTRRWATRDGRLKEEGRATGRDRHLAYGTVAGGRQRIAPDTELANKGLF